MMRGGAFRRSGARGGISPVGKDITAFAVTGSRHLIWVFNGVPSLGHGTTRRKHRRYVDEKIE